MQLRDYVAVLRRRRFSIFAITVLVVATAVVLSLVQTPVYQAATRLLLRPNASIFDAPAQQRSVDPVLVQTETQLLRSEQVRSRVTEALGRPAPKVTVDPVGQTPVVDVKAESRFPQVAAQVSNAYATAYIEFSRQQADQALAEAAKEVQARIATLQEDVRQLDAQLAALPSCSGPNPPRECDQRQRLNQDRDAVLSQIVPLKQRLNEVQVGTSPSSGPQVLARAAVPTSPIRPNPLRNALLGLAVGLVLGICLAFTFEHFDDAVRTKEDLERAGAGLPVIGMIPSVTNWKKRAETQVVSQTDPMSAAAEAYRSLRTAVKFMSLDRSVHVLQVTSPNVSEGKSTTVSNLAVALARAGEKVVVVCCDLRRPRLHHFFGLPNDVGFTSVILGMSPLGAALQAVPGEPGLRLLASGQLPPNPSELLASSRAEQVFSALKQNSSVVLIDCPPVIPVTDAAVLSSRVDGTLLVATVNGTARTEVTRSVELLRQVGAPLLGIVLNGTTTDGPYAYQYQAYVATNGDGPSHPDVYLPDRRTAKRRPPTAS
jgi:polysaccharide biosynthesis transport protein